MPRRPARLRRRARFVTWLKAHYSMRQHMTLILLLVMLTGLVTSRLLLAVGLRSMPLRYGLVVLVSYGAFFGVVRLWIWVVHRARDEAQGLGKAEQAAVSEEPSSEVEDALDIVEDVQDAWELAEDAGDIADVAEAARDLLLEGGSDAVDTASSAGEGASTLVEGVGGLLDGLDEGVVAVVAIVVLGAIVAVLLGAGIWVIWEAPLILPEVAADVVLAASLAGTTRAASQANWAGSLLKSTIWKAVIVAVLAVVAGLVLSALCPGATKASEAIRTCLRH